MGQSGSDVDPSRIGRYRVEAPLGAGGVGVVYAALDPELGRRVAVKLLRPDRNQGPDAGDRLRQEAQAMARLSHPNVATVFDVGEHEGGVYIAMELVEGRSLREWLTETPRPWREVLRMYFQAGLGLAAAHDRGVVHRDFKPANVLVGRDGRARVVDFGLASRAAARPPADEGHDDPSSRRGDGPLPLGSIDETIDDSSRPMSVDALALETTGVIERGGAASLTGVDATMAHGSGATLPAGMTRSGAIVGTPAYMAPELFQGEAADARTDQFSFCVALFEGLYGYRPFGGATTRAIATQVLAGRIVPPPESTRVPRWVHASVVQGLSTRRSERHSSVRSMLASIAFLARVVWD